MNFKKYNKNKLFEHIYSGLITENKLPINLYYETANELNEGVEKGFGKKLIKLKYNEPDFLLLHELQTNIYLFSGAKTFQQIRVMRGAMVEGNQIIPFNDFRKKADSIFGIYNESYLQAEYNTSIGNGQISSKWLEIEQTKKLFPMLKYSAIIDGRTSDICKPFDGIVLPVDDKFWNKYTPLNHFNCRCTIIKIDKYSEEPQTAKKDVSKAVKIADEDIADNFKFNPGKDKLIFSYKHPYFTEVPKEYKEFAKTNFGLPIPELTNKNK